MTEQPRFLPLVPDPRPELLGDTREWRYLLTACRARDVDLYVALAALRAQGARLEEVNDAGDLRLARGELAADAYLAARRQVLVPRAAALRDLLRLVSDAAGLGLLEQGPPAPE